MNEYIKPIIIENEITTEGIFALSSGYVEEDWHWEVWWANHNSGSHSEIEVRGKNNGAKSGYYIAISLNFLGNGKIIACDPASKATETRWNEKNIIITYHDIWNPGEQIVFGLPSIVFSEPAFGEETNGSYHISGGAFCNCIATDAWEIQTHIET